MAISDEDLPGWTFHEKEVSAGVYLVSGTDSAGRKVEKKGIDPDALVEDCKHAALRILEAISQRESS
jgi:hypothetical protein